MENNKDDEEEEKKSESISLSQDKLSSFIKVIVQIPNKDKNQILNAKVNISDKILE